MLDAMEVEALKEVGLSLQAAGMGAAVTQARLRALKYTKHECISRKAIAAQHKISYTTADGAFQFTGPNDRA